MEQFIYLVGLNHRTAGVDVRERFALTEHCSPAAWPLACGGLEGESEAGEGEFATETEKQYALSACSEAVARNIVPNEVSNSASRVCLDEALILSTCNRVEILVVGREEGGNAPAVPNAVPNAVFDAWARACGRDVAELVPHTYVHRGADAVRHLFCVAASLDSMVLGEPQILGQLKDAFRKATEARATKTIINRLLHKAFSVAKRVRTETEVASSAVSISYAAVELAKRIFGVLQGRRALLMGAGEMAELAATHLMQNGIERLYVTNRTHERGEELAARFKGEAVPFDRLLDQLVDVDIVISSTGSPEAIIRARHMREVLKKRKNRPMFFIDIAVPRDIDPDVNNLDNVYLYDIDDLKEVVEENLAHRQDEAHKALGIIDEEVTAFRKWLHDLALQPTLVDLVSHFEQAADEELARTLKRLGTVDEPTRAALAVMMRSLAHKLAHDPLVFVKNAHTRNVDAHIGLVRRLFHLDDQ